MYKKKLTFQMKKIVKSYMIESKRFDQEYIPTVEEYATTGIHASGYPILAITSLVAMNDTESKDVI